MNEKKDALRACARVCAWGACSHVRRARDGLDLPSARAQHIQDELARALLPRGTTVRGQY